MSGTATVRHTVSLADLGSGAAFSSSFTLDDLDEMVHQVRIVAANTGEQIGLGAIAAGDVQLVAIYLIDGGTSTSDGLAIDMEASTYATKHAVLLEGESIVFRPGSATSLVSVKNLHADNTATYEYWLFGTTT